MPDLSELLKAQEEQLQEAPPAELWNRLEEKLEKNRRQRKRRNRLFLQPVVIVLIVLILILSILMVWHRVF